MPGARLVVPTAVAAGGYVGGPYRGVIHTTEVKTYRASTSSYYGHQSWPHATIDEHAVWQHFPINRSARALKNLSGGVETNRLSAVQCEVVWKAAEIRSLPAATFENLRRWMRWVESAVGVARVGARFVGPEASPYGLHAPQRFSTALWQSFNGWCGHQHVPENDHWDPGALDIAALLEVDDEPPTGGEEDDGMDRVIIIGAKDVGALYASTPAFTSKVGIPDLDAVAEIEKGKAFGGYVRMRRFDLEHIPFTNGQPGL